MPQQPAHRSVRKSSRQTSRLFSAKTSACQRCRCALRASQALRHAMPAVQEARSCERPTPAGPAGSGRDITPCADRPSAGEPARGLHAVSAAFARNAVG